MDQKDKEYITATVEQERKGLKEKLDAKERKTTYEKALRNGVFFLSGKAGSGKTGAIINLIKKFKEDRDLPIFVFTPTGKANLVIRDRLKKFDLHKEKLIRISTIHRFLASALWEFKYDMFPDARSRVFRLSQLVSKILWEGKLQLFDDFRELARDFRFNPKVVIIDEASMVDEVLLGALFSLINPDTLEHLIIVGDEKQLPPIGIGRPFVDALFHLKRNNLEGNYIHLESNLRFDPSAGLGSLSELFGGEKTPFPTEIEDALKQSDNTLELFYFGDQKELKEAIKRILNQTEKTPPIESLHEMFGDVYEGDGTLDLEKIQIITPRRVGNFGSWGINVNSILDGRSEFLPRTKLICEKNMYLNVNDKGKWKGILGLANGSIGYIKSDGNVYFEDLEDLESEYGSQNTWRLKKNLESELYSPLRIERDIDFGYAFTVHKSQGSDFDYVILVISEMTPFIVREILYTAFTRPKNKLFLLVHNNLKDELPLVLAKAYDNSSVKQRSTLLFEYKVSPFRPYLLVLKSGKTIEVGSKIEHIIAKTLDDIGAEFEYEPMEFFESYHVIPDFKLIVDGNAYYLEHLGNMKNTSYRNRWLKKFEIYKNLGIAKNLLTTSEREEESNVEKNIKEIINDIKSNKLKITEGGYSHHHYYI